MSRVGRVLDLVLIVALVTYATVLTALFWRQPLLLSALLMLPPAVIATRVGDGRRAALMAASGVVLGPLTEVLCVAGGLWRYPETGGLPLVPLWIFPLWATFPAAIWIVVRSLLGKRRVSTARPVGLLLVLATLGLQILLFVKLGHSSPLAFAAGLPLAAAVLLVSRRRETVVLMATGAIIGPVCESVPNAAGTFIYALPEWNGMPLWLPLAYAIFAALVGLAAEAVCALTLSRRSLPLRLRHQPLS